MINIILVITAIIVFVFYDKMRNILGTISPSRFPQSPLQSNDIKMNAVVMKKHGSPEVLEYVNDFPAPIINGRQILCKVVAAGLNPVDFKMRKGPIWNTIYPKPKIIGCDFAGVVQEVPLISKFKPGDHVFAMLPLLGSHYGSYADKVCIDEKMLALAPDNVDLESLAVIPLVACTVVQALRPVVQSYKEDIKGKKILIQAGSGGLGTLAIQYCANVLGMYVITTASSTNFDLLKSLGAAEVIDYHNETIESRVQNIDVFFDTIGYVYEHIIFKKDCTILRKQGKLPSFYIKIASSPYGNNKNISDLSCDPLGLAIPEARLDRMATGFIKSALSKIIGMSFIKYHFVLVHPDIDALHEIGDAMKKGLVKAIIQQRFPMKDASVSHKILEAGHVVGKLLLFNEK